ncbi:MAG: 50S ribosomal protein L23 [Deltaproteobacteria bacterium]|nr:50S ribosomal protein L23 [Deltaproteobacteria bacterium]
MELYQIIKKTLITEKSTVARDAANQYNFEVHTNANRIEVGRAVEKIFKVKVLAVRIMNVRGKKKRSGKVMGQRSDWKKAIVTLAPGSRIETGDGV